MCSECRNFFTGTTVITWQVYWHDIQDYVLSIDLMAQCHPGHTNIIYFLNDETLFIGTTVIIRSYLFVTLLKGSYY